MPMSGEDLRRSCSSGGFAMLGMWGVLNSYHGWYWEYGEEYVLEEYWKCGRVWTPYGKFEHRTSGSVKGLRESLVDKRLKNLSGALVAGRMAFYGTQFAAIPEWKLLCLQTSDFILLCFLPKNHLFTGISSLLDFTSLQVFFTSLSLISLVHHSVYLFTSHQLLASASAVVYKATFPQETEWGSSSDKTLLESLLLRESDLWLIEGDKQDRILIRDAFSPSRQFTTVV